MNLKVLVVFLLTSVLFGSCVYLCVKKDIDTTITSFEAAKQRAQVNMNLDYQAYTKPEDDKK